MTSRSRNKWIDVAKGMTIVLMVMGHAAIPVPISRFIYSFHMPLFFIASGWTTNWNKYSVGEYCIRKMKTLLLPFIIYSAVVLTVKKMALGGEDIVIEWLTKGWQGYALWFIPVLFVSLLFVRLVYTIRRKTLRVLIIVAVLIFGVALKYFRISMPWHMSSVPYASFLIVIGTYMKRYQRYIDKPRWYLCVIGLVVVSMISHFWKLDMAWNDILPVLPLTVGALAGTTMMFTLSSMLVMYIPKMSTIIQTIGRETFVIVAFSQIIVILCNTYLASNSIMKYLILIVSLVVIAFIKNRLFKQYKG